MAFQLDITEAAINDAAEYVQFIREGNREPEAAERWFRGLVSAIYSLEQSPARCSVIPEGQEFPQEIRHLIYFSHRIIFGIDNRRRRVTVYRVLHGARDKLRLTGMGT